MTNINREDFLKIRETLKSLNTMVYSKFANKMATTCIRCINFDEISEKCRLAKIRPPARVIAYGCSEFFDEDELPF